MTDQSPESPQPKKSGLGKGLLIGCAGILVLTALLVGGFLFWLYSSGKDFITDQARDLIVEKIEEADLPVDQKEGMVSQIDRVATGFKEGNIELEKMGEIIEEIAQSPVFSVLIVYAAQAAYLEPSGLPPEEKQAAREELRRFALGAIDHRIPESEVNAVLDLISRNPGAGDERELKDSLTDSELQTFIAEAKAAADDAGVTNEEVTIDLAKELERVIDRALGESP